MQNRQNKIWNNSGIKIAVLGATGFIGSYILDSLIEKGFGPSVLVREGSEDKLSQSEKCRIVTGDIQDEQAIHETINGTDCIIFNIGIIRQFPHQRITFDELHLQSAKRTIDIALQLNIKRFILMSANGVSPHGTEYQKTKYLAEKYLKKTDLDWTIFRPSLVFGPSRGKIEFCTQLRDDLIDLPLPAPLFYTGLSPLHAGQFKISPIHVKNVAEFFTRSISDSSTFGECYHLGGSEDFSWKELISIIAKASGKTKLKIPTPAFIIKTLASLLDGFSWFPITRDQLNMLLEGNTCDSKETFKKFGIKPIPFTQSNLTYLKE